MRAIESSAPPPVLRRASRLALLFLASLFSGNAAAAETPDHGTGRKLGPAIAAGNRVIAAGGGRSAGGGFAIHGTIGQPDADALHPASGGGYGASGGFWAAVASPAVLADIVFRNGFDAGTR